MTRSCVAHAVVKAIEIEKAVESGLDSVTALSVLEVYYLARELMMPRQTAGDVGTFISHACDAARRFGVCSEASWPFNPLHINEAPPWSAMRNAYENRIFGFYKIDSSGPARVDAIRDALHKYLPVIIGTDVDDKWQTYEKGQVLYPCDHSEDKHATVILGEVGGKFIGENSWGSSWGDNGFYLMDPAVLSSDQVYEAWVAMRAA